MLTQWQDIDKHLTDLTQLTLETQQALHNFFRQTLTCQIGWIFIKGEVLQFSTTLSYLLAL